MRRFPVVSMAMFAVAVAACTSEQREAQVPEQTEQADTQPAVPGGPITVNLFCGDQGPGIGARVHPWRAHTGDSTQLTWNIVPQTPTVRARLEPVDPARWPFQAQSDTSVDNRITAQLLAQRDTGAYQYKLTLICPTDTIVIDPIVIVDQ